MSERTFDVPGSLSLADFETTVRQTEEINGFLKSLGKSGDRNVFTIERRRPPQNLVSLETFDGSAPPAKDGHDIVCTGDCLVESEAAKIVAYRAR